MTGVTVTVWCPRFRAMVGQARHIEYGYVHRVVDGRLICEEREKVRKT